MGEISDINYSLLAATSDNFIRLETLKEANDRVSNVTHKLPLFRHYDIDEVLQGSLITGFMPTANSPIVRTPPA